MKGEEKTLLRACVYVWEQTKDTEVPHYISKFCNGELSLDAFRGYVLSRALHLAEERGMERIASATH